MATMDRRERDVLAHALSTLEYLTAVALKDAPEAFTTFRVAPDVRTPEIFTHMSQLTSMAQSRMHEDGSANPHDVPDADSAPPLARFRERLRSLAIAIEVSHDLQRAAAYKLRQEPILDAVTHGADGGRRNLCTASGAGGFIRPLHGQAKLSTYTH